MTHWTVCSCANLARCYLMFPGINHLLLPTYMASAGYVDLQARTGSMEYVV